VFAGTVASSRPAKRVGVRVTYTITDIGMYNCTITHVYRMYKYTTPLYQTCLGVHITPTLNPIPPSVNWLQTH
jgi:hypothetical protein